MSHVLAVSWAVGRSPGPHAMLPLYLFHTMASCPTQLVTSRITRPPFLSHTPQANFHLLSVTCPFVSSPTPSLVWSLPSPGQPPWLLCSGPAPHSPCSYIPCRGSLGWFVSTQLQPRGSTGTVTLQPTQYGGCEAHVGLPPILKNQHSHPDQAPQFSCPLPQISKLQSRSHVCVMALGVGVYKISFNWH